MSDRCGTGLLERPPAKAPALDLIWSDRIDASAPAWTAIQALAPAESASRVLSRGQKIALAVALPALATTVLLWPNRSLLALMAAMNLLYLAVSLYKLRLITRSYGTTATVDDRAEAASLREDELPVYTLLIPLYREAAVLPNLVGAIKRLDYPIEHLDVKLLLEEDDVETIAAARVMRLPASFELVIVPDGKPKGKPRACNAGLARARGDFVTIYDAEDLPEPDQLKRVVAAFHRSPAKIACVQCKLNYYNQRQNLLTRWFTSEYSMWFDLTLPGLTALGAPIPLGGTSNHFPTALLREFGGWDPYNVTEDADLGIRLFRRGYRTMVIDSTTWEEANSHLPNWIRQRSRWIKGYVQTWLVQMRQPVRLWRQIGWRDFLSFQAIVGGGFFLLLANPFFWGLAVIWYLTEPSAIEALFPQPLFLAASISFFIGNFVFVYTCALGALRRGYFSLVKYTLLLPLYWALMSVAAWKGALQLIYRPSYWEKTTHGLGRPDELPVVEPAAFATAGKRLQRVEGRR